MEHFQQMKTPLNYNYNMQTQCFKVYFNWEWLEILPNRILSYIYRDLSEHANLIFFNKSSFEVTF